MVSNLWRWDGVESLMTLEEGKFKVPIDGCINRIRGSERPFLFICDKSLKCHYLLNRSFAFFSVWYYWMIFCSKNRCWLYWRFVVSGRHDRWLGYGNMRKKPWFTSNNFVSFFCNAGNWREQKSYIILYTKCIIGQGPIIWPGTGPGKATGINKIAPNDYLISGQYALSLWSQEIPVISFWLRSCINKTNTVHTSWYWLRWLYLTLHINMCWYLWRIRRHIIKLWIYNQVEVGFRKV